MLAPENYFVFSSFKTTANGLEPRKASQFVVGFADKKIWELGEFQFKGTTFQLLTPRLGSQIDKKLWESGIRKIWPAFLERFGQATDHLVFVDLQGPISGGPLGENVIGIFASDNFPASLFTDMEANLGWKPHNSTKEYVKAHYPKSRDQWSEYLLGTFVHEIAHLYFGFGVTRERIEAVEDLWFSLGLGMVHDMEITTELLGRPPQLEIDLIQNWKKNISAIRDIDHRLIHPDKSQDSKYKFDRKKVFAHGKAAFFLDEFRKQLGKEKFDKAVLAYLKGCGTCESGYTDFKKYLGAGARTAEILEIKYGVR